MEIKKIFKVLIIEDDDLQAESLEIMLDKSASKNKIELIITIAETEEEAKKYLLANKYDICFFDLDLHGKLVGIELLKNFREQVLYPVILTSFDDKKIIDKGIEAGSKTYLVKPCSEKNVFILLDKFLIECNLERYINNIRSKFITENFDMLTQLKSIPRLKNTEIPTYISGETGTGKQLIAEIVHQYVRPGGPFVEANCSAMGDGTVESFLYGHIKGAFTGAINNKQGVIEKANGGILFLDEIDKMPMEHQDKLLKVIEQKKYLPVGGKDYRTSDFILISAGSRNLRQLVNQGLFRDDLSQRLIGNIIELLPLRERKNDIPLLLNYFIKNHPSGNRILIPNDVMVELTSYSWPGNVRELMNCVNRWQSNNITKLNRHHIKGLFKNQQKQFCKICTPEMIKIVEDKGLQYLKEQILEEVFSVLYVKNHMKANKTRSKLGIHHRKFMELRDKFTGRNTNV